jgi:predicted glycoside hydrolase/deacetylase ChbG (UPF0249 family)
MDKRTPQLAENGRMGALIITADDYGYAPGYDRGIAEAAGAGAVDAVSAMVGEGRSPDPAPLAETGVGVGLHLELPPQWPPGPAERRAAVKAALQERWERFEQTFGAEPAHLDGHLHCHALPQTSVPVARFARERDVPVRAVSPRHARLLHCIGVRAPDRLIGRMSESDPAEPAEISAVLAGGELPHGVTEWIVHPGHSDAASGSRYDAGRSEDLALVLRLSGSEPLRSRRCAHAEALGASAAR